MKTTSADELIRNPLKILDQVVRQAESLAIERDGRTIAKIVPVIQTMTAAQALQGLSRPLSPEEGQKWLNDSKASFEEEKLN